MKKYEITINLEVEAETEDEAVEKIQESMSDGSIVINSLEEIE